MLIIFLFIIYCLNLFFIQGNRDHRHECIKTRIFNVKFEQIVQDPIYWAKEIYSFVDLETPDFLEHWAEINSFIDRKHVNNKFRGHLGDEQVNRINVLCSEYMAELDYDF